MFFYDDLTIYTKSSLRAYSYINSVWETIFFDFLYVVGLISDANITLHIESDRCFLNITSAYRNIFNKEYTFDFNHSLRVCHDFDIDITFNVLKDKSKNIYHLDKCRLYFDKTSKYDEGFIEYESTCSLSIENIDYFKEMFFLSIVREIQFSITKNIIGLDIEKEALILSDLDADFELAKTYSKLKNINIKQSINLLKITSDNKQLLMQLLKNIDL